MNIYELIGLTFVVFTSMVGAYVVGRFAYRGIEQAFEDAKAGECERVRALNEARQVRGEVERIK